MILLISASRVARITGVSHQCPARDFILLFLLLSFFSEVALISQLRFLLKC
jgi:hypothetical protein